MEKRKQGGLKKEDKGKTEMKRVDRRKGKNIRDE